MRIASLSRLALFTAALALAAAPALAQYVPGGHDETSENMPAAFVVTTPPTPGVCAPGPGSHLLISEVVVTPTAGEFVEICNPTGLNVVLDTYYLTDDWFVGPPANGYFKLPAGGYVTAVTTDFIARFPAGASIAPSGVATIAVDGAAFFTTYGVRASFEILGTDPLTPDMVNAGGNVPGVALLTNTSEVVALFHWDGTTDNVCDVDICQWGALASGNAIDKTGIAIDGPDADLVATPYNPDTPRASQTFATAPGTSGQSIIRQNCLEQPEAPSGGNGCILAPVPTRSRTWGAVKTIYR